MNLPTQPAIVTGVAKRARRCGLTLVEIMVALVMTLIVLYAMMAAFQYASGEMSRGRAVLELSNQMRAAVELLRSDLNGLTLSPKPYTQSEIPSGYFEYVEGPRRDYGTEADKQGIGAIYNYLGDVDDIIAMTTRSTRRPFRGRFNGILESNVAEVIWWTQFDDRNADDVVDFTESISVFRRVLLIRPDLNVLLGNGAAGLVQQTDPVEVAKFFATNDISASWVDTDADNVRDVIRANTLAELARRENRFAHDPTFYPNQIARLGTISLASTRMGAFSGTNVVPTGDDILLTQVAGFDVKAFSRDAGVEVPVGINLAVEPSDIGFVGDGSIAFGKYGSFVDLGYFSDSFGLDINTYGFDPAKTQFETYPTERSGLRYPFTGNANLGYEIAYCTWTPQYEHDGIDQDNDGLIDEGTNGIDDDAVNGVDDNDERETLPPYPYALRGIKVTFRMIEKNSRQLRQQSVIHSFVPE